MAIRASIYMLYFMSNFKKFIPPKHYRPALLTNLGIGEICFLPEEYSIKVYNRLYEYKRKYGKLFEYSEIKNGILIKRVK